MEVQQSATRWAELIPILRAPPLARKSLTHAGVDRTMSVVPRPESARADRRPTRTGGRLAYALQSHGAGMWLYAQALAGARAREALEAAVVAVRHDLEGDAGHGIDDERAHLLQVVRREVAARTSRVVSPACPSAATILSAVVPGSLARGLRGSVADHIAGCVGCSGLLTRAVAAERFLRLRSPPPPPAWLLDAMLSSAAPAPTAAGADVAPPAAEEKPPPAARAASPPVPVRSPALARSPARPLRPTWRRVAIGFAAVVFLARRRSRRRTR